MRKNFVSEEEERDIAGEMAEFMLYQVERELGRVPDKIDLDLYMQRKIGLF